MAEQKKEATQDTSAELQKQTVEAQRESGGRPQDDDNTIVIKAGSKASLPKADGDKGMASFVIEKDVILEVAIENAKRPSHILLFHKGQTVSQAQLDAAAANAEG